MAQKLLKRKPHTVAPGRARSPSAQPPAGGSRSCATVSAVLVGTYKAKQLAWIKRHGIYNYPVKDGDEFDEKSFASIKELWLYADVKGTRHVFEAEFIGIKTREELISEYGYPDGNVLAAKNAKGAKNGRARTPAAPHGSRYYVFKTKYLDYGSRLDDPFVIARTADFGGRSAKVKKAIEQFKADGEFAPLEHYLPFDLSKVPRNRLRVCELAYQMSLWELPQGNDLKPTVPFPPPEKGKFTFIDLFAGIGGIRLGYQSLGGKCVFSSEWDKAAAKTYFSNFGEMPFGDIQKIEPKDIPDFDVLLAGFPCQPFSIIGDKEGFAHETQGTLFFNIEKILLAKKPKAFMLENVRNLTAHDGGRTFKVILSHLRNAGYDVHYKVLNALDYGVPQKRERIIICGFRKPVEFEFPPPIPKEQRKTVADIIDKDAENDKSLRVRPAIRESRLARLRDRDFPKPYISHENVAGSITPHSYSCALRAGASANYILINDERRPSPREMLRIQGFPDDFKIVVNYGQIKHQTGNSVAVPVIRAVAERLIEKLKTL